MQHILALSLKELEEVLGGWGEPAFRAKQIFGWIYQKGVMDFSAMSNLSQELRKRLREKFLISSLKLSKIQESRDQTKKLLFVTSDGKFMEAVIIPAAGRVTGCISSQLGCKFACRFCASGASGFKRNLSAAEMLEEVLHLKQHARPQKLTHVVFMGTGEPLDNYPEVIKTIRIINAPWGLNIGARRITLSTCGIVPGIDRLAKEDLQVELSVSLHAADDLTRNKIMPVNKVYPLRELMRSAKDYIKKTNRQITFEYCLIKGFNSDLQSARKLGKILKDLRLAKVNLIPANRVEQLGIEPPNKLESLLFRGCLIKSGIPATFRKPRGEDIEAACGQLRLRYEK
jgi:23S rRNA (adenine2503-C2)-methyltransferase